MTDSELTRFSVRPVMALHYAGFRGDDGKLPGILRFVLFWLPAGAGLLAGLLNVQITAATPLLAASSLLIGAMLSLFVFLVNLRIKVDETEKLTYQKSLHRLIAYSSASSLYVALVAAISTVVIAMFASLHIAALSHHGLVRITYGVIVLLLVHLGLTLTTVVRRIFGIYFDVFRADFNPALQSVRNEHETPGRHTG